MIRYYSQAGRLSCFFQVGRRETSEIGICRQKAKRVLPKGNLMNWRDLCDVGIIAFVPDQWDGYRQSRHQILFRLSEYFPTVWVNPCPDWRAAAKNIGWFKNKAFRCIEDSHLLIYTPQFWLPKFYRPKCLATVTAKGRAFWAQRALRRRGCSKTILYIWRPQFDDVLDLIDYDVSCYHIDDEYTFGENDTVIIDKERKLIERVDQIFIHSRRLQAKKALGQEKTVFVPNGVDFSAYATEKQEPEDLAAISRPRIGYTGIVKRQLDWELIHYLINRHPRWNFVFVGPVNRNHPEVIETTDALSVKPNVFFLGGKSVDELAAYPQNFDVCIMPYRIDEYTESINPLKLYEYLAGGRPVVGSRIDSLVEFESEIELPKNYDDWDIAIERALKSESNTHQAIQRRKDIARRFDWNIVVKDIAVCMMKRLKEKESGKGRVVLT